MADFSWSTTAQFDDATKVDIVTITDEYGNLADQIQISFPYADKDASLVSYWRCENNANDETGNNNGTVQGATYTASGKFGGAYNFDGTNDYIDLGNGASLNVTTFSLSLWFKADVWGKDRIIATKGAAASGKNWHLFYDFSDARIEFNIYGGKSVNVVTTPSTGTWYHFVGVISGGAITSYINGNVVATDTGLALDNPSGSNMKLGIWIDNVNFAFDGIIDEVKFYSRALSAAEVAALYNSGNKHKTSGTWTSTSQTNTEAISNITIAHSGLSASNYIGQIQVLDASDDSVICTANATIITGTSTTLLTGDFDVGLSGTNKNFKLKIPLVSAGSITPVISEITVTLESGGIMILRRRIEGD